MVTSVQSQPVSEGTAQVSGSTITHGADAIGGDTVLVLERPRPKIGAVPLMFRHPAANDTSAEDGWSDDANGRAYKSDTQFMMLLLVLFIAVNALLAFLLYSRDKSTTHPEQPAVAISAPQSPSSGSASAANEATAKAATLQIPATAQPATTKLAVVPVQEIAPVAVAPVVVAPVVVRAEEKPAAPPVVAAPAAPVESSSMLKASLSKAYVTPVTSETSKATAAPVQGVTVSEHKLAPAAGGTHAAPATTQTRPTSAAIPAAVPVVVPVVLAPPKPSLPVATAPAATPETGAARDLLSVISKD